MKHRKVAAIVAAAGFLIAVTDWTITQRDLISTTVKKKQEKQDTHSSETFAI